MRLFWIISFSFLGYVASWGQLPELNFNSLPTQRQLSSQFTTCITQDQEGYIWIGTVDGLNRLDGHEVRVFRNNGDRNYNLTNNNIRCLHSDSQNRLWVGTIWGLSVYVPSFDSFEVKSSSSNPAGLASSYIYKVAETDEKEILVAAGKAIYRYQEETASFRPIIKLKGGDITTFVVDGNQIWTGQDLGGGIKRFNYEEGHAVPMKLPHWIKKSDLRELEEYTVMDMAMSDRLLWVATRGNGIKKIDFTEETAISFLSGDDAFVHDLHIDRKGFIWACSFSGLKIFDPENNHFIGVYEEPDGTNNIKRNPIGIFQDRQMNYWVIYSEKGFDFSVVDRGFHVYDDSPHNYWPLGDENVLSVAEDAEGNLWTGSFNGGITVFYWAKDSIAHFNFNKENKSSLGKGSVFDLFLDSKNQMWVGSYSKGLQRYDAAINGFISYVHDDKNPASISGNDVRSIAEDSMGNLWVAVHGKGVDFFDRKTGEFTHYNPQNSNLSLEWTNHIILDAEQNLWVATSNGLNKKKADADSFQVFVNYDSKNQNGFKSNDILCIHESPDSVIWVGTTNGLYSYNPHEDHFTYRSEEFNNQYICSIEQDKEGKLWISTHGGLTHFDPDSNQVFNFDFRDGLQANDFNLRASFFDGRQYLFFGGPAGLNVFDPANINYNLDPPEIVFTELQLFNEPVKTYGLESPLPKNINMAKEIKLDYADNFFTIKYAAINFINPSKNKYAYKLEGFEDRWNYVGNKREATYTNLHPGTYIFRVKAANNDGVWNKKGISIKVIVSPPWYMTGWFFLGVLMLLMFIVYIIVNIRTRMLRHQKAALTALVNERTKSIHDKNQTLKRRTIELNQINKELAKQKKTIGEQARQLQKRNHDLQKLNNTKDRLFSVIAHDVRSPFNTIVGFSSLLKEIAGESGNEIIEDYARYISESSNQVLALMENLLYWARSQTNEIHPKIRKISVRDIFHENIMLLKETLMNKSIALETNDLHNDIDFEADLDMMRTVVRNLMSNAIKFTPHNGKITLRSFREDNINLRVEIIDTGNGLSPSEIEKIIQPNNIFSTPGTHGEKGSGLGLTICKEFVELHNGELLVESTKNRGSSFGFIIPLRQ